jgi:hypothetical protein
MLQKLNRRRNKEKKMKKVIALVLGVVFMTVSSAMAISGISKSTFTASVDFTGVSGVTYMSILLKNRTTGAAATAFSFVANASVLGAGTTFYAANEYATIFTTWTNGAAGRVMIYTDNEAADASPKYTGSPTTNPAGLVCNQSTSDSPLGLVWRAVDTSTGALNIGYWVDVASQAYAMHLYEQTISPSFYCYIWMKDKGDPTAWYGIDDAYPTVKSFDSTGTWIQYAEGQFGNVASPDSVYIGANLGGAKGGRSYKTNTMRFDMIFD